MLIPQLWTMRFAQDQIEFLPRLLAATDAAVLSEGHQINKHEVVFHPIEGDLLELTWQECETLADTLVDLCEAFESNRLKFSNLRKLDLINVKSAVNHLRGEKTHAAEEAPNPVIVCEDRDTKAKMG